VYSVLATRKENIILTVKTIINSSNLYAFELLKCSPTTVKTYREVFVAKTFSSMKHYDLVQGNNMPAAFSWKTVCGGNIFDGTAVDVQFVRAACTGDERSFAAGHRRQRLVDRMCASFGRTGAFLLRHVRRVRVRAVHFPRPAAFARSQRAFVQ